MRPQFFNGLYSSNDGANYKRRYRKVSLRSEQIDCNYWKTVDFQPSRRARHIYHPPPIKRNWFLMDTIKFNIHVKILDVAEDGLNR